MSAFPFEVDPLLVTVRKEYAKSEVFVTSFYSCYIEA